METESKLSRVVVLIDKIITKNVVALFTLSNCDICSKAKIFLDTERIKFYYIDIDEHNLNQLIQRELVKKTGQMDAPYMFIHQKFVGNYNTLIKMYHEATLLNTIEDKSQKRFDYDLIVVGGGSGGLAVANKAAIMGKRVAIFDFIRLTSHGPGWRGLGGTCINAGCISKKLMHQASLIGDLCEDCRHFGWQFDFKKQGNHNWKEMVTNAETYIKKLHFGLKTQLSYNKVRFFNACVIKFTNENTIEAKDKTKQVVSFSAQEFIIATGGRPFIPDFPGNQFVITSDELFSLTEKPNNILIIGAGFVALECAGFLNGLGVEVTILVRRKVLKEYDTQISDMIVSHMESLGIKFIQRSEHIEVFDSSNTNVSNSSGSINTKYKVRFGSKTKMKLSSSEMNFDYIMVATGREYEAKEMGLENLGVEFTEDNKIIVNKFDRTGCRTIFAIGDVTANHPNVSPFATKAGILLARRIAFGDDNIIDYDYIPVTLFTPLEYGFCGFSEEKANQHYGSAKIEIYQNRFHPLEWAMQQRNQNRSFVKLICLKPDEKVIGIHILGPNAAEITQGFALAMKLNGKKSDFDNFIGIYPTCAEVLTKMDKNNQSSAQVEPTPSSSVLI